MNDSTDKTQWRFMWTHATGKEHGAQWRDQPPTLEEIAEWRVDMDPLALRIEKRVIREFDPEVDEVLTRAVQGE